MRSARRKEGGGEKSFQFFFFRAFLWDIIKSGGDANDNGDGEGRRERRYLLRLREERREERVGRGRESGGSQRSNSLVFVKFSSQVPLFKYFNPKDWDWEVMRKK